MLTSAIFIFDKIQEDQRHWIERKFEVAFHKIQPMFWYFTRT